MKYFAILLLLLPIHLFSQTIDPDYYVDIIEDDFIGVYLPVEYINSLKATKNHSVSMHLNDDRRYHDLLMVNKNIIRSDSKWHDSYAIKSEEANDFQFIKEENEYSVIDNNGFSYIKIGDNPGDYSITTRFIADIVFADILRQNIGIEIYDETIRIPFLYAFLHEEDYRIHLDDVFLEEGGNIFLYNSNKNLTIYVSIENNDYVFYEMIRKGPFMEKTNNVLAKYSINTDRRIVYAMMGLDENYESPIIPILAGLSDYDKRVIINAMFALNGYAFASEEWRSFFSSYPWYTPNPKIRNDVETLNVRQKRLLEFLNG